MDAVEKHLGGWRSGNTSSQRQNGGEGERARGRRQPQGRRRAPIEREIVDNKNEPRTKRRAEIIRGTNSTHVLTPKKKVIVFRSSSMDTGS